MTSHSPEDEWHPISDLDTGNTDAVNLILIQNTGIRYPSPRIDPIFPALKPQKGSKTHLYTNSNLHASVLACRDKTTICGPDPSNCHSLRTIQASFNPQNDEATRVSLLLIYALTWSDTLSALRYRDASALDASSKLVGSRSLQLPPEQWKVEVERFFATNLARIQIDARNIARGMPDVDESDVSELSDIIPAGVQGMCEMYKFKSIGWKNVNVYGFLGSLGAGLIVLVCSITREEDEEEDEEEKLWIERPLKTVFKSVFTYKWGKELRELVRKELRGIPSRLSIGLEYLSGFLDFVREACRKVIGSLYER
jgi:hypothetical protein